MHIIYKVTYLPHLQNKNGPYFYIGSKFNYKGKYYGSVASRKTDWYTNGLSLKDWWKIETTERPENFLFEVLQICDVKEAIELLPIERDLQKELNVLSSDYFNESIAVEGFVSGKRGSSSKQKTANATKAYWDSPAGLEKKKRMSERNRQIKSAQMKEKWANPSEAMLNRVIPGRPKGAKDKAPRRKSAIND